MKSVSEINKRRKKVYKKLCKLFIQLKRYPRNLVDEYGKPAGHFPDNFLGDFVGEEDVVDTKVKLENQVRFLSGFLASLTWVLNISDKKYAKEFQNFGNWLGKGMIKRLIIRPPSILHGDSTKDINKIKNQIKEIKQTYKKNIDSLLKESTKELKCSPMDFSEANIKYFAKQLDAENGGRLNGLLWALGEEKNQNELS